MVHVTPKPILVGERIQQLDMLLHIQEFSSMIAVITGAADMGKTAILQVAANQLSIHHQVISFSASNIETEKQVLDLVSEQLNSGSSWAEVEVALREIHANNESVNVLIDDAHLLSQELLEILAVRALSDEGWHLALAGDVHLYDMLIAIQKDLHHSNLVHHIELMAVTEDAAADLAEGYFKALGEPVVPISSEKITHLWKLSEGSPGKLIDLLESEKDKKVSEAARFPIGHVAAIGLIAVALSFSYIYKDDESDLDPIDEILAESVPPSQSLIDSKPVVVPVSEAVNEASDHDAKAVTSNTIKQAPLQLSKVAEAVQVPAKSEKQLSEVTNKAPIAPSSSTAKQKEQFAKIKKSPVKHPLLNAPKTGFALQLLGVRNRASAEKVKLEFAQALKTDQLSVYETEFKGQPWFVVVYGPVIGQAVARQKAGTIGKKLKNQPWVRPMAKIQEDIRRVQH